MRGLRYIGGLLLVGAAGAAVGLLMAPARGDRVRRHLVKRLNRQKADLLKRGRAALEDVGDYVVDELQQARRRMAKAARF
jgi:gas vesicle protein